MQLHKNTQLKRSSCYDRGVGCSQPGVESRQRTVLYCNYVAVSQYDSIVYTCFYIEREGTILQDFTPPLLFQGIGFFTIKAPNTLKHIALNKYFIGESLFSIFV